MADSPRTQLERAYRLIQQERLDEASALLQPLVKKEPDNADAWWLLANAVTEPEDARTALQNVLRLKPNHAEAKELLDQLTEVTASPATTDDFGDIDFDNPFAGLDEKPSSAQSADLDKLFDDDVPSFVREGEAASASKKPVRDFSTTDDEALLAALDSPVSQAPSATSAKKAAANAGSPLAALSGNRRLLLPIGIAALVLVLLIVVVVVILPALNPPPAATSIAAVPSPAPTAVPSLPPPPTVPGVVPTGNGSSGTSLADVSAQAVTQLKTAGIDNAQVNVVLSSVGQTLTAHFCGPYGPKLEPRVSAAMDIVAAAGAKVSDQVQGVGVEVDSCTDSTQVYAKEIAAIKDVLAYVNKSISLGQFSSGWKTN